MATNPLEGWKIQEVVSRVLSDPAFAEQLKNDGLAAIRAGSESAEWQKYFSHFASSPTSLVALKGPDAAAADCTCNSNTATTFTTLSTLVTPVPTCCGLTTTTTTTTTSGS